MLAITFASLLAGWTICDRLAPEPRSFHSRGFDHVAEIFPPFSRQNSSARPMVYIYAVGYPGRRWDVSARLLTSATLPHETFPGEAVVSRAGDLVTLDEYYQSGQTNAVVLVDGAGSLIGAFALTDLLRDDEILSLERSDCGIHWRDGASYFFLLESEPRFYIALSGGLVLEFHLETGRFRRGRASAFPDLLQVMGRSFANERAEPWATSLRFSSITDLVRGR